MPSELPKTPEQVAILERMKLVLEAADALGYDSRVSRARGDWEGYLSKRRGSEFALDEWKRLSQQYRSLWLRQRHKQKKLSNS